MSAGDGTGDPVRRAGSVRIRREDHRSLPAHAAVPTAFDVREVVDLAAARPGDSLVRTRPIAAPWRKDYDTMPGNEPLGWPARFDVRSWIHLAAYDGESRVGGAIVVAEPGAVAELEGRAGSAVLWDLRVAPSARRNGIGRALLAAAEDAARRAGGRELDVETQDVNVPACRLYGGNGFSLAAVVPEAYPEAPGEAKLLWSKRL